MNHELPEHVVWYEVEDFGEEFKECSFIGEYEGCGGFSYKG